MVGCRNQFGFWVLVEEGMVMSISLSIGRLQSTILVNVIKDRGKGGGIYRTGACPFALISPSIAKFHGLLWKYYRAVDEHPSSVYMYSTISNSSSNLPIELI